MTHKHIFILERNMGVYDLYIIYLIWRCILIVSSFHLFAVYYSTLDLLPERYQRISYTSVIEDAAISTWATFVGKNTRKAYHCFYLQILEWSRTDQLKSPK